MPRVVTFFQAKGAAEQEVQSNKKTMSCRTLLVYDRGLERRPAGGEQNGPIQPQWWFWAGGRTEIAQ